MVGQEGLGNDRSCPGCQTAQLIARRPPSLLFKCFPIASQSTYRASRGSVMDFFNSLLIKCVFGGRTGTRTLDPLIKSQLLYRLSYAPSCVRTIRLRPVVGNRRSSTKLGMSNSGCPDSEHPLQRGISWIGPDETNRFVAG